MVADGRLSDVGNMVFEYVERLRVSLLDRRVAMAVDGLLSQPPLDPDDCVVDVRLLGRGLLAANEFGVLLHGFVVFGSRALS